MQFKVVAEEIDIIEEKGKVYSIVILNIDSNDESKSQLLSFNFKVSIDS